MIPTTNTHARTHAGARDLETHAGTLKRLTQICTQRKRARRGRYALVGASAYVRCVGCEIYSHRARALRLLHHRRRIRGPFASVARRAGGGPCVCVPTHARASSHLNAHEHNHILLRITAFVYYVCVSKKSAGTRTFRVCVRVCVCVCKESIHVCA